MYYYTNNAILATAIASRLAKDIKKGYDEIYKKLLLSGIIPVLQRMDNETSKDLIELINEKISRIKSHCQVTTVYYQ